MSELCYNRGCGQSFQSLSNTDGDCVYHPGAPIFHDALKGWSCCRKRTTDFAEFLEIPGCTRGRHSNQKLPETVKVEVQNDTDMAQTLNAQVGSEYIFQGPKSAERMERERPSADEPMMKLPQKVSVSLQEALEKLSHTLQPVGVQRETEGSRAVQVGTVCKNSGCMKTFQGPQSNSQTCSFHPGVPIFHEGMKYWSCCKIKTTEFDDFLQQPGCVTGKHTWIKMDMDKRLVGCRHDWHQTGSVVVFTIYAKTSNSELSYVDANRTALTVHIVFEEDKIFHTDLKLWGVIDVNKSVVNMTASKVEISLTKADPRTWARLDLLPAPTTHVEEKESERRERSVEEPKELVLGDEPPPLEDEESDDSFGLSDSDEEFD
uniref:Cysteine and histidine-rich domain-containing protein 1-like protein n=1 Tax=Callorhinchus milii TaxID=7868 RepID=V9L2C9_CALMI